MCGIFGLICNESVPTRKQLDILFSYAEKRGKDGVGFCIIDPEKKNIISTKVDKAYSEVKSLILDKVTKDLKQGNILLAICRNMPETETSTLSDDLEKTMQPIVFRDENVALVHNGAIHEKLRKELTEQGYKFKTFIDSECIIGKYLVNQRNMRKAVEEIDGGFSFLLFDLLKKRLIIGSSFLPLAQSYARGFGYIIHSDIDALQDFLQDYKNMKEVKYMRTWEDFYFDELQPYIIYEIDIDSQLVNSYKYKHRYTHPVWTPSNNKDKTVYVVLASSGIDSTTTILTLKNLGKNVIGLHFRYGQKSEAAELHAFLEIMKKLQLPFQVIDLNYVYRNLEDVSQLTNDKLQITTAGIDLKSTAAWVPGRNMLFASVAACFAESLILNNTYNKVYICGGFPNISEESCIIDCEDNKITKISEDGERYVVPGEIKEGDILKAYDFENNQFSQTVVKEVMKSKHQSFYELTICRNGMFERLYVSGNHPFAIKKGDEIIWVKARNLDRDDLLFNEYDNLIEVKYVKEIPIKVDMINYYCEPYNNFLLNNIVVHNSYPDNSQRFVDAFQNFVRFGTLPGAHEKIIWLNPFSGLTKKEELVLLKHFDESLFGLTVSCDRAILKNDKVYQCSHNGQPACGSGLLSKWAAELVGIKDTRNYYEVEESVDIHMPKWKEQDANITFDVNDILNQIILE